MAEWPYRAAVDCGRNRTTHQTPFDRKGTPREGVVRLKDRWSNNSGLNIFTTAITDIMMPFYLAFLSCVHIGTLTNIFK